METGIMDEIPASEEPVQVTDQILVQDEEPTRVLEPEIQENHVQQQEPAEAPFDITKLKYELQQGYRIYVELLSDSNRNVTWPFLEPVDADSLGLWDYYDRIKEPMCFATIGSKFTDYKYTSITEVVADMRLILENCYRYNGPNHWVSKLGQKLEKILEQKLALLSRSLRDKVTLTATMSVNQDLPLVAELEASGRRRSSRQNYLNMVNGENSSSLVNHVKIQEESEEKERRRQREKEKKEANQALLQDLVEWEKKELTPEITSQLHSMWEIPSVGSFLYLVRNILNLEDINLTEFELSFIYPNKSSLLAKIFTALLITPHQRKSIYKKPVMKFKKWESKLKEKLDAWYKVADKEGFYVVSVQFGIDLKFFDILGKERNPLEEKSYLDLTLYQRIWVLKTLCDVCFHKDYDLREKVNSCDFIEQRELFLGNDGENRSYIYFPVFQTTDIRIYQHNPLLVPKLNSKPKKEPSPLVTTTPEMKKPKKTPKSSTPFRGARSSRLRQLRSDSVEDKDEKEDPPVSDPVSDESNEPEQDPLPVFKVEDGFSLVCYNIETLKTLAEQFAEPVTPPKKRGRRSKPPPPRKRCEVDLHETLMALLQELEKYEGAFSRNYTKARIKIMKESLEPEPVEEPEEVPEPETIEEWGSELSEEDDGAKLDAKDEDFKIENEYGISFSLDNQLSKSDNDVQPISDESETGSTIAIQTISPRHKRKRRQSKTEDETLNNTNCTIAIQTPNPRMKKKAKKWSPTKEENFINSKSVSSPSVVISAVSAEESVKAATVPRKGVSVVKTLFTPTSGDKQSGLSPNIILINSLSEALKRAQSNSTANAPQVASIGTTKDDMKQDGCRQEAVAIPVVTTKASPTSSSTSSTSQAQNLRKRILVSPEGKAHEVKPCVTIVCKSTSIPAVTPSIHSPIQRKTTVHSITSTTSGGIHSTPITIPRTVALVTQNKPTLSTGSVPLGSVTSVSHQRPNILSHNRKQASIIGKPGALSQPTTGNPPKGRGAVQTHAASHNHTYALPSAPVSQSSATVPQQQNPSGLGISKARTTPSIKMVQIISNAKKTNVATANSLYVVPSTTVKSGVGINALPKTVGVSGQTGVTLLSAKPGITSSNVLSHPRTIPVATSQVSSSQAGQPSSKTVQSKGGVSSVDKTPTSKQTKVVFIPASSVDAKSPLANFKPQTLTTSNGQSICGYAVVVPPGSPEEVNAVISSALRKPASVHVKPPSMPAHQTTAAGKITGTVTQAVMGKATTTTSGVSSTSPSLHSHNVVVSQTSKSSGMMPATVCQSVASLSSIGQPRPGVATGPQRSTNSGAPTSVSPNVLLGSSTTHPSLGVATSSQKPNNTTVPISVNRSILLGSNITQPRSTAATTSPQKYTSTSVPTTFSLLLGSSTPQPRPGIATIPQKPSNTSVPTSVSVLLGSSTPQPRPGIATSPQKPSNTSVPTSVSVLLGSSTTQPLPTAATSPQKPSNTSVPTSVSVLLGSSTTQPLPTAATSPQKPSNTRVPTSISVLLGSSTTQPRPGIATSPQNVLVSVSQSCSITTHPVENTKTTTICSSPQNAPILSPKATTVATSTKAIDSTSNNQRAGKATINKFENGRKCHPDQNSILDDFSTANQIEIKNGPWNKSILPQTNNTQRVPTMIAETVDILASHPSNSDTLAKNVITNASDTSVTSTSIANEKLTSSDELTINSEGQKTVTICNGVSVHPALTSIDSIQNIKHTENKITHNDGANGITDLRNSETPALCKRTPNCPTVSN